MGILNKHINLNDMAEEKIQAVQDEKIVTGKTVFSFSRPSPMWATWIFRAEFVINKALIFWLSGTSLVPANKIKETFLIIGAVDLATWLFAKSLGVKKEDIDK